MCDKSTDCSSSPSAAGPPWAEIEGSESASTAEPLSPASATAPAEPHRPSSRHTPQPDCKRHDAKPMPELPDTRSAETSGPSPLRQNAVASRARTTYTHVVLPSHRRFWSSQPLVASRLLQRRRKMQRMRESWTTPELKVDLWRLPRMRGRVRQLDRPTTCWHPSQATGCFSAAWTLAHQAASARAEHMIGIIRGLGYGRRSVTRSV